MGIISEEAGFINNNSEYTWIIDPLDGTNNFAAGLPIFPGLVRYEEVYVNKKINHALSINGIMQITFPRAQALPVILTTRDVRLGMG